MKNIGKSTVGLSFYRSIQLNQDIPSSPADAAISCRCVVAAVCMCLSSQETAYSGMLCGDITVTLRVADFGKAAKKTNGKIDSEFD